MPASSPVRSRAKSLHPALLMTSAVLITLFLFYIDEGYYSFKWMQNAGNWIMFGVYASTFWLSQYFVSKFILRRQKGAKKVF